MTTELHHEAHATDPKDPAETEPDRDLGRRPDLDAVGRPPASSARLARTAGLLYLVVAIFGGFAQVVRLKVYEPGNAAGTAANIVANAT
jgi:hypothetical protein